MKVWVLPAEENWICDLLVEDFQFMCRDIVAHTPRDATLLWLLSDWRWRSVSIQQLREKMVLTTVHHIVKDKFDETARRDFAERDEITNAYHVYNSRTLDFVRQLTVKPIHLVPYWANQHRWRATGEKVTLREKYKLPASARILMSAQRDTEGNDLMSPKLEKGADRLADAFIEFFRQDPNVHILLGGWRRQYVVRRLTSAGVPFTYIERPPQETLNELYQCADLYVVTAREEGGPQSLLEAGLVGLPMVSTPVGIAEQVLPAYAINDDVTLATPAIPDVEDMKLPGGMSAYRQMFMDILQ